MPPDLLGYTRVSTPPAASGEGLAFLFRALTAREAAAYLSVSEDAVRSEAEAGRLPGQRVGDDWRFLGLALARWLFDGASAAPVAASLEERLAVAGCLEGDETLKSIVEDAYRRREEDKVGGRK